MATVLVEFLEKRLEKRMCLLLLYYARLPTMNVFIYRQSCKDHYNKEFLKGENRNENLQVGASVEARAYI